MCDEGAGTATFRRGHSRDQWPSGAAAAQARCDRNAPKCGVAAARALVNLPEKPMPGSMPAT